MNNVDLNNWEESNYYKTEDFNTLYGNIKFSNHNMKKIGIISSLENEGKTFISMELLKAFARDNKKVVLIDADLRKSVILQKYTKNYHDYQDYKGFSNYLVNDASIDEIICKTNIDNAFIIPSGHQSMNPTNLLSLDTFDNLLNELEEKFDMVLIDMPPINSVFDGAIIASKCKNILLVIKSNSTNARAVKHAKEQIEFAGGTIIGSVLNMVSVTDKMYNSYGDYYHNKEYKKYYREPKKKGLFKKIFSK